MALIILDSNKQRKRRNIDNMTRRSGNQNQMMNNKPTQRAIGIMLPFFTSSSKFSLFADGACVGTGGIVSGFGGLIRCSIVDDVLR